MAGQFNKKLVIVMALGMFVVVLDNTIMNVSITALVHDLGTTVSGVQAAISLNALMMAAFVLMGGKMADIIGMRKTFLGGAVIYIIGSLLASFSHNLAVFILGWCAIQGFGAAMMLPNVNTIIRANVAGAARAKAYGTMAGVNAIGTAVGPLVGGFLTTYFSWRWAFRLEVFILVFVLLRSGVIPKDTLGKIRPKLDVIGVVWQAAAMMLLIVGTLLISDYGLLMAKKPLMILGHAFAPFGLSIVPFIWAAGVLCLRMFVDHERKLDGLHKTPLVTLALFRIKEFVQGLGLRFIHVFLIAGATFSVPLFLQVTFGLSAFATGFVLLALTAGLLLTSIGGNKFGMQYYPKKKVGWGFLTSVAGLLIMALYVQVGHSVWGLVPGLFIYGMGLGLIGSQIVNLIMSAVPGKQTAEGAGITSTLETLGSSVGTAIVGTILVLSLTNGVTRLVKKSTVYPPPVKTEVSQKLNTSIEVVSSNVLAQKIPSGNPYKTETVDIYNTARQNAFTITMLFMAFVALMAYLSSRKLPGKFVATAEAV
jgi:MFS family permease